MANGAIHAERFFIIDITGWEWHRKCDVSTLYFVLCTWMSHRTRAVELQLGFLSCANLVFMKQHYATHILSHTVIFQLSFCRF